MNMNPVALMKMTIGGAGWGFGFSGLVPLLAPSVELTSRVMYCGAAWGAVAFGLLYLLLVWQGR